LRKLVIYDIIYIKRSLQEIRDALRGHPVNPAWWMQQAQ
jgi:hypothetical protein